MAADDNTFRVARQYAGYTGRPVTPYDEPPDNDDMDAAVIEGDAMAQEMGRRLRAARKARGWTQRELAMQTGWSDATEASEYRGFSPSRIGNFEQGTRRLGIEEAKAFERIFGQPAAYFLGILDAKEAEIIATLRRQHN